MPAVSTLGSGKNENPTPAEAHRSRLTRSQSVDSEAFASSTTNLTAVPLCGKCKNKFDEEEILCVECERCSTWFHQECTRLTKTDYKSVQKRNIGIHWFCEKCDNMLVSIDEKLRQIQETVNDLSKQKIPATNYSDIVSKIDTSIKQNETIQSEMSKQIKSLQSDLTAENRAKNVVVFGIKENENLNETVSKIYDECGLHLSTDKLKALRLGAMKDGKSRPVKISLASESQKWDLLKRINSVKPDGIFARLDLTKEEQQKDFLLRSELKKIREQNPSDTYKIVKNKIVQLRKSEKP